jgi:hypothetical protein
MLRSVARAPGSIIETICTRISALAPSGPIGLPSRMSSASTLLRLSVCTITYARARANAHALRRHAVAARTLLPASPA